MLKEIYIVHFDNNVGALGCVQGNPNHFYSFCPQGKFIDWVKGLKEDYPEFALRCVRNEGIEEYLRKKLRDIEKQPSNTPFPQHKNSGKSR